MFKIDYKGIRLFLNKTGLGTFAVNAMNPGKVNSIRHTTVESCEEAMSVIQSLVDQIDHMWLPSVDKLVFAG